MYAVVGCGACHHLWIVEGRPDTSQCPRCGSRKPFAKRKRFVETDDVDHAREVRASMLANRQGEGEAFAELDSFAELESTVDGGVVDDEAYLEASGIDVETITEAGERASRGPVNHGSKKEIVESALSDLDDPTEADVLEYAESRGVSPEYTRNALEKLRRRGAVSEHGGRYRLL